MMLAETLPDPNSFASIGWVVVILAAIAFGANSVLDLVSRMRGDNNKPTQIAQPLAVELVEELHEQFAGKRIFEEHVKNNTERHGQIFKRIEKVEEDTRNSIVREVAQINNERRQTLESLNRRNERMMFALGKIAQKLNVDIEPTE